MEEFISKKEVLAKYGISYGALYRWKRMGLIPEDWFIRQSTQTGQETVFPKALMCARMEEILAQKNDTSLEELAERYRSRTENLQLVIRHASGTGVSRLELSEIAWIGLSDGTDLTQMIREAAEKGTQRKDMV
ncbi:MAG: DUF4004 family protein [Ruminococcaceae bacterium]|nr:DUF4004 family protein [Oscillospiraceae bacterium]